MLQKVGIGFGVTAAVAGLGVLLSSIVTSDVANDCAKIGLGGGCLVVKL